MISGLFCNHYFLRMLASIGRGHYDAAYDPGTALSLKSHLNKVNSWYKDTSVEIRLQLTLINYLPSSLYSLVLGFLGWTNT